MHDADTLFWDLDGTLTDPYEGITRSVAYALHFFDIEVPDRTVLCPFIGPPLKDSFMRFYGFSSADAELAIARYRDYFAGKGLFENTVYPGIPSLLDALENAGRRHVLATSKPSVFAERILTHFGLRRYFSAVAGSDLDGKRVKKRRRASARPGTHKCQTGPLPDDRRPGIRRGRSPRCGNGLHRGDIRLWVGKGTFGQRRGRAGGFARGTPPPFASLRSVLAQT